ncbi:MAG TPA: dynamin family protein [Micromonosporaceae bacterium]|nr:dynamin family protein [Micromonosporaceae bacterium]
MTTPPPTPGAAPPENQENPLVTHAAQVVDLALRACEAYHRPDLTGRLTTVRRTLADPAVHIVVAGEFKQGKSSLVNALVGANVCPVDDDVATAVPTYVRHGENAEARLLYDGDPPQRSPIPLEDVRAHVIEGGRAAPLDPNAPRVIGAEITLPRRLLQGGLVLVDTPGVGGLGSAHAAASLAAIAMADAVIFVTDAAQELTRSELDFLTQAKRMCQTVVCALTKTDFYPAWRKIRELNEGHLRQVGDIRILPVSSSLRALAVKANDTKLNEESGFPDLVRFVTEQVAGGAARRIAARAMADVVSVADQIISQFETERTALADPQAAQRVVDELNATKARVDHLKSAAAKWSQTLTDGIADLNSDIDYDLRSRIRNVLQEADDALDEIDPADMWPQMESWLQSRLSYELLENYTLLRERADALSADVAEHFREASGQIFDQLTVYNPTPLISETRVEHKIELEKMKAGKQAMVALKSAYGGVLMFTMLGALTGIALGPLSLGIGLVMGHKGLREEKKRQLNQRRQQARNAVRRYCDEVSFVMGKDSRDTLRRVQRELRDHYAALAESLSQSNTEALARANEAVRRTQAERETRLRDVEAELTRLRQLKERAEAVAAVAIGRSAA